MIVLIIVGIAALAATITMIACLVVGSKEDEKEERMYNEWQLQKKFK